MVMIATKTVSDQFVTMTTREVPTVVLAKEFSAALNQHPVSSAISPMSAAALAPEVTAAAAVAQTVSAAVVPPTIPRGRLYDIMKIAVAAGVGLVLGAGVMYVYLRSFSKIGKEINAVVQSVNSLTAEVEEMKKNYRLRKRRSLSSATSRSSDDDGATCRRRRSHRSGDDVDGGFDQVDDRLPASVVGVEEFHSIPTEEDALPSRKNASAERVSRGSSVEDEGEGGGGSNSVYTTASERRDRRSRSASRSSNGFESTDDESTSLYEEALSVISGGEEEEVSVLTSSTRDEDDFRDIEADALFDLPTQLLDLIDVVDPLFEGNSHDKAKAHVLLKEWTESLNTYPDFLWRLAKACHVVAQVEGAAGDVERKKLLLFQAYDCAKGGLALRSDDADVQKWYAITLGSIGDYQGTQERILNGFKFKDHIQYAITLRPGDPTLHYLLGRWCYAVYMLSWWERRAAAALFAEPPSASIQEALDHFLEAERLKRTAWKGNKLMIAKCYVELNDLEKVRTNLSTAFSMTVFDQDDIEAQKEITSLISKYGQAQ